MSDAGPGERESVRYQPDESPPLPIAAALGSQYAILIIARIVVVPVVIVRAAGGSEADLSWVLFAAIAVCGVTTMMQALRFGRLGSGYVAVMGTSLAVVGVGVTAVAEGGLPLLATLVLFASAVPLALSFRLTLFRKVLTPTVSGTVIMLIPATLMPSAFGLLTDVPAGTPDAAAPLCAGAALLVIVVTTLEGTARMRLWSPVIGVIAGCLVALYFGLYDANAVFAASWIGFPVAGWPGLDLDFGTAFWALLPAFVLVALIESVQTISCAVAVQRASWRRPRAVDFRAVQGAAATAGVGNMLAGIAGTVPNTLLSTSAAVTDLTGAAARRIGVAAGAVFIAMAFLPKVRAAVLAIPGPVVSAYLFVLMTALFVLGMKMVVQGGVDYRKGLIAGAGFWAGVGFQYGAIFPEFTREFAGGLLQSGVTAGGLVAILLTLFTEATKSRPSRIRTVCDIEALPEIREFLAAFASRSGWGEAMARRLDAVAEEMVLTLLDRSEDRRGPERRSLSLTARREDGRAVLEIVAAPGDGNLEDRIALLGEAETETPTEREISLRLLRHLASSIRHEQYRDAEFVTLRVDAPDGRSGARS